MDIFAMSATIVSAKKSRCIRPRENPTKRSLALAFQNFTHAADSLERSYVQLQSEVVRLRRELEKTNRDLVSSLEENAGMRRYLARIVEGIPCGILVVNREGTLQMMNPEAKQLLAIGTDRWESLACDAMRSVALLPEKLRDLLDRFRQNGSEKEHEVVLETPRGLRTFGLACAVLGEESSQDSASASVFLLRDVTEEKRRSAERELAKRKESLAEMATLLAHEIRNPLGSLELFAGLLADAAASQPDLRRWTDHIQAGLRSLSATVNNVLQFHSQPSPQLSGVNLGRLLRESVDFLRPLARQGGLQIELHNSLGEIEILGDAQRLQQMFFNLALNAFRAMSLGGVLTIRVTWPDAGNFRGVRVDFQDTGRGIAAEHLPKLFQPGFTTNTGNPGLGLTVCRTVMEQHHGHIGVASVPGKGTTFSLFLLRAGEEAHCMDSKDGTMKRNNRETETNRKGQRV